MPFLTTPPQTPQISNSKNSTFSEVRAASRPIEEQKPELSIRNVPAIERWKCNFPFSRIDGSLEESLSTVRLSVAEDEFLSTLCEKHGLTVATVIKVAWSLALRAYTGAERVGFGYKSALEGSYPLKINLQSFQTPLELMSWVQQSEERPSSAQSYRDLGTGDFNTVLSFVNEDENGPISADENELHDEKVRERAVDISETG